MNRTKFLAMLVCLAILLTIPVAAAYDDTPRLSRVSLCVPPTVAGQALGAPSFADDAPLRLVSYQWYAGSWDSPAAQGSAVSEQTYFLTVTARVKDVTQYHVDDLSYLSTDGACTPLSRTVDDRAGAITATFAVPVYQARSAAIALPKIAAGENIADTLYDIAITAGDALPEMTTLLVYDGDRHIGTGVKNSENFFIFTDAAAEFIPTHTYTVLGAALLAGSYFTADAVTADAASPDTCTVLGDAGMVGFRWSFTCETAPAAFPFADVAGKSWYYEGVDYCFRQGLMNGVADDRFSPDAHCSRAMLVTILYRLAGSPAQDDRATFADVPAGRWYTAAIDWAYQNKLVNGYSADRFGPDDPVTREQFAAIAQRYAAYAGVAASNRASLSDFPDAGDVSAFAVEPLRWAVAEGLIQGKSNSGTVYLAPQGKTTRAECATMLMRLCKAWND